MKILFFFTFLLTMNLAQGQTTYDSEEMEFVIGDEIIYGTHTDINPRTIAGKALELLLKPIGFRKNWPLYGYALPKDSGSGPCDRLNDNYFDIQIGKAAIVLQTTENYVGLPVRSIYVTQPSGSFHSTGGNTVNFMEYPTFSIGAICRWLDDSFQHDEFRVRLLRRIGDDEPNIQENQSGSPSSESWFLLAEEPLPTLAADIRVATRPYPLGGSRR